MPGLDGKGEMIYRDFSVVCLPDTGEFDDWHGFLAG